MNDTLRPTRYRELSYRLDGPACWRIYGEGSAIRAPYATKDELLADLDNVARSYGCAGAPARPKPTELPEDVRAIISTISTDLEIIGTWMSIGDPHRNRLRELSSQAMQVRNRHNF